MKIVLDKGWMKLIGEVMDLVQVESRGIYG